MEGILERVRQVVTVEEIEREQVECRAKITRLKEEYDLLDHLRNTLSKASRGLAPGAVPKRVVQSEYEEITAPACESSSTIKHTPVSAPPMLAASNKAARRDRTTGYTPNMCAAMGVIKNKPGITIGQISHEIKVPYGTIYGAIRSLIKIGHVVKTGDNLRAVE